MWYRQCMQTSLIHGPASEGARRFRLNWRNLVIAVGFTAAQFALLLMALWSERPEPMTPDFLPAVVLALPAPEPPAPPQVVAIDPSDTLGGSPAPPVSRSIPLAPIVLTEPEPIAIDLDLDALDLAVPGRADGPPGNGDAGIGTGQGAGIGQGVGVKNEGVAAPRLAYLRWAPSMRFGRLHKFYPEVAREERIAGQAQLECEVIRRDRVRNCRLLAEFPEGHGFGQAALDAVEVYRMQLTDMDGKRIYGERIVMLAKFRPKPQRIK